MFFNIFQTSAFLFLNFSPTTNKKNHTSITQYKIEFALRFIAIVSLEIQYITVFVSLLLKDKTLNYKECKYVLLNPFLCDFYWASTHFEYIVAHGTADRSFVSRGVVYANSISCSGCCGLLKETHAGARQSRTLQLYHACSDNILLQAYLVKNTLCRP